MIDSTILFALRRHTDRLLLQYEQAQAVLHTESRDLQAAQTQALDAEEAQRLTQTIAQQIQQQAHTQLASVVSRALEAVFDEPYALRIDFERKRGRTEAVLLFDRDGEPFDPLSATGGGCVAVAALGLRIAHLCRQLPPLRRVLVADEPLQHVSADYRPRLGEMLFTLARELGIQLILTTHSKEYMIGKVIRLE